MSNAMKIARNLGGGLVFLPCFVLLHEQHSPWILPLCALVALGIALRLRRILPAAAESTASANRPATVLSTLNGLPPADSSLRVAFWIALLLQAAVVLAVGDSVLNAALPLSIGIFLFVWRWSASQPRAVEWWSGRHPLRRQTTVAILLTALTLIVSIGERSGHYGHRLAGSTPPPTGDKASAADASSGYYGIILYPPRKKRVIVVPAPHSDALFSGAITKPTTIPFDGSYWYMKSPGQQPGARAHIAHGMPTEVNVRSTDSEPLLMEAHQNLGRTIDLACCSEMDIAITNADTRPGEITLLAVVTGSTPTAKFTQTLGQQSIASSQRSPIPTDRAPVQEVLRFPILTTRTPQRFDAITILFMTPPQRSLAGAKVSIDSFELIPKP